jgi:hypothetical protein
MSTFMCAVIDRNAGPLQLCEFLEMTKNLKIKTA